MSEVAVTIIKLVAGIVLSSFVGAFIVAWWEDRKWRKRNE